MAAAYTIGSRPPMPRGVGRNRRSLNRIVMRYLEPDNSRATGHLAKNILTTLRGDGSMEHSSNLRRGDFSMADRLARFDAAGHGLLPSVSCPTLPTSPAPARRGRLRNGATPGDFLAAPRCGARTRADGCCRQPAMRNGRCRMHGGLSTGPKTAEGRARCAAARRTHGFYSAETAALRREANLRIRRLRALIAPVTVRRTAGHELLPANSLNSAGAQVRRSPSPGMPGAPSPSGSSRPGGAPAGGRGTVTAGHEVLPSLSMPALDAARPVRKLVPRRGLVQRCLMGSTALGLGLTVAPAAPAGHRVLPSFSAVSPQPPARLGVRLSG
jgi:hypothetical protein